MNELRGEGCPDLWREYTQIAIGVMEKQLYREKGLMTRMFTPQKVNELDHLSTASGITKNEGLIDEPPDEYKYEDVDAIPLDPNSTLGKSGNVCAKLENQPRISIQPSLVSDEKFFCIEVEHQGRDENEDDPMTPLS